MPSLSAQQAAEPQVVIDWIERNMDKCAWPCAPTFEHFHFRVEIRKLMKSSLRITRLADSFARSLPLIPPGLC
jgi:hypothetical protein